MDPSTRRKPEEVPLPVSSGSLEHPPFLKPVEGYEDWRRGTSVPLLNLALGFARQYRVEWETAYVALLAGAAHTLGGARRLDLPQSSLAAPFNVLVVTAEEEPLWTSVPLRFLNVGIEQQLPLGFPALNPLLGSSIDFGAGCSNVSPQGAQAMGMDRASGALLLNRIIDTVVTSRLDLPVPRSPLDDRVSLGTPSRGLAAAMAGLPVSGRLLLEESLRATRVPGDASLQASSSGAPAFFWQIPEREAAAFFRQQGWLRRVPFLLLRTTVPGFPQLSMVGTVADALERLFRRLFEERLQRAGNPRKGALCSADAKPVMEFMDAAARWQSPGRQPQPWRWVGELGLKFALVTAALEGAEHPDEFAVERGLELAKHFARRHLEGLSVYASGPVADYADLCGLSPQERRVFLRICDKGPITLGALRRGFNRMSANERDTIVAGLMSRGLVCLKDGLLSQSAV